MPDFQRLMQVVEQAMSPPPADRSAYLRKECEGDESMFDAAKNVLAAEERAAEFLAPTLDSPAAHSIGQGLESRTSAQLRRETSKSCAALTDTDLECR